MALGSPARADEGTDAGASAAGPGLDVPAIIHDVEALRGITAKRPITVQRLDAGAFLQALHQREDRKRGTFRRERALWLAFGFGGPRDDPEKIIGGVLDEQILGFYDPRSKELLVREDLPPGQGAFGPAVLLAHEIEHALQDQEFGLGDPGALPDDDAREAASALFEGDATAVMIAYQAHREGKPLHETLARLARRIRDLPPRLLVALTQHSEKIRRTLPIVADALLFPYLEGFAFVERFYQTGDFALVDELFRHRPASTAQIADPKLYLAGVSPVRVDPPTLPAGSRRIDSGRLGALGSRILFGQTVSPALARLLAADWAGDAFTLAEGPGRRLSCTWVSTWKSELGARAVEAALTRIAARWKAVSAGGWALSRGAHVSREGTTVVLIRGLPAAVTRSQLASLAGLVEVPSPPHPPLDVSELAAEPRLPEDDTGTVLGDRYRNERLGLTARIPPGFFREEAHVQLRIRSLRGRAVGVFDFLRARPPTKELRDTTFKSVVTGFSVTSPRTATPRASEGPADLGWAKGWNRSWHWRGPGPRLRAVLAPACGGTSSYLFIELWSEPAGEQALDRWVRSFDVSEAAASDACSAVAAGIQE